ncbi:MAG TPA: type II secretion system protein [Candidatus Ozemobacteraceae bacterium]|nr:type II secretion system protein [Candidatus Ozemobacteraceae bacterium]
MKRRTGFTLIELMIVIAVLGVATVSFFTPLRSLLYDLSSNGDEIQRQEQLTSAFAILRKAFAESSGLVVKDGNEITLLGGPCSSIRREANGNVLAVQKGDAVFRLELLGGMTFGPFQAVDAKTVWGTAHTTDARFPMFWRCGR